MSNLVTTTFCCAGNCLCFACNNIFEDTKKINPKLFSRIGFIILGLLFVGLSLLILFFAAPILQPFSSFIQCPNSDNFDCLGISSVYRMSLSLVLMHFAIILLSLCGQNCANVISRDCWSFKFLLTLGIYISFLFLPNSLFSVYAEIARYLSLIFLLYQIFVTLSFAHVLNIQLVNGLDNTGECKYKFWLITLTLVFSGLIIYWTLTSFINFGISFWNFLIICLTLAFGVLLTLLSVTNLVNRKRLLTSLYIFSFISYMTWSSLNSKPNDDTTKQTKLSVVDILVGIFYLFMSVGYLGFYIKKEQSGTNVSETEEQKEINKNPILEEEDKGSLVDQEGLGNASDAKITAPHFYFHTFMIFMSVYYCMLLTNWTVVDSSDKNFTLLGQSLASFWIKICAVVVTVVLYLWILIAPVLFPDREFNF